MVSCGKDSPDGGFKVGLNNVKSVLEIYGVGYEMVSAPGPSEKTSEGLRFTFDLTKAEGRYYLPGEDILIFRN